MLAMDRIKAVKIDLGKLKDVVIPRLNLWLGMNKGGINIDAARDEVVANIHAIAEKIKGDNAVDEKGFGGDGATRQPSKTLQSMKRLWNGIDWEMAGETVAKKLKSPAILGLGIFILLFVGAFSFILLMPGYRYPQSPAPIPSNKCTTYFHSAGGIASCNKTAFEMARNKVQENKECWVFRQAENQILKSGKPSYPTRIGEAVCG